MSVIQEHIGAVILEVSAAIILFTLAWLRRS
ncbi:hypothetical protein SAMN05444156_2448 [Verrucomicrobium sp. GAS474]|nr:hypothetical protein SAMN05444156_2448 [Verrucomicrobium sp. GAS474]